MEYEFSLKDIDDVMLKATSKIEINNRIIEPGEIIAAFDHLELNNYHEVVETTTAHGGFDDRARVWWETTKSVKVSFSQGTFSPTQLTLFANAKLFNVKPNKVTVTKREKLETDENYQFELKETPSGKIFIYDQDTGDKIDFSVDDIQIGRKRVPSVQEDIPNFHEEVALKGIPMSGVAISSNTLIFISSHSSSVKFSIISFFISSIASSRSSGV